ncbi:P protein [Fragariocoptes setiger]|uniref:P protein n=1 Tax=Fragariocoptes setiger TaxID=1670756 RepID=A0ABQ7S9W0_9ACAR|nr:P protein [Fragariocoptes setiger]
MSGINERTPLIGCMDGARLPMRQHDTNNNYNNNSSNNHGSFGVARDRYRASLRNAPTTIGSRLPTLGQLFSSLTISNEFNRYLNSATTAAHNNCCCSVQPSAAAATDEHRVQVTCNNKHLSNNNNNNQQPAGTTPEAPFYCVPRAPTLQQHRNRHLDPTTFIDSTTDLLERRRNMDTWLMQRKRWLAYVTPTVLLTIVLACLALTTFAQTRRFERSDPLLWSAITLIVMYVLMIFELVHRTLAAFIGATLAVTVYTCVRQKPDLETIISWNDTETTSLLFGMMLIMAVLSDTGLFDYMAVECYVLARGLFWPQLFGLSVICASVSAVVDNVSTMLLIAPTVIKLCELQRLAPSLPLIIMVMFSNIGGLATPIGDPPNLIIINNRMVQREGITFAKFVLYCTPNVLLVGCVIALYIRLVYRNQGRHFKLPPDDSIATAIDRRLSRRGSTRNNTEQEITIWHNIRQSVVGLASPSEDAIVAHIDKQIELLEACLSRSLQALYRHSKHWIDVDEDKYDHEFEHISPGDVLDTRFKQPEPTVESFDLKVTELRNKYPIKDMALLIKCLLVLSMTLVLFILQSFEWAHITLGWASLFAGLTMLVLSNQHQFEGIILRIEWSTLMFFFGLFVVMEVVLELGLIVYIGQHTQQLIEQIPVNGQVRSFVAVSVILWVAGLASAVIDNVPITAMLIKIIETLVEADADKQRSAHADPNNRLPAKALVCALTFGACLGGNGSLIGASANLVTAGIAERFGHPIGFSAFARVGLPITILSLIVSNIYLGLVFCVFDL